MLIPEGMTLEQLLLNEIGLDFYNNSLVDQDTRNLLTMNGRTITPSHISNISKDVKLMNLLFSYFAIKLQNEQGIYADVVYYKPIKNSRNSPLAIKANNREYISRIYNSESLKYLDLICQLNGGTNVDLSRFDIKCDT